MREWLGSSSQSTQNGKINMKNNILALVLFCSTIATMGIGSPARAEQGRNIVGPSVAIGGGITTFGVDSKFGLNENLSVRPFVYFPNGGTDFGAAFTYEFNIANPSSKVQITPFIGGAIDVNSINNTSATKVSFVGGADFDVSDSLQLKAALDVPLSSGVGQATGVRLSAGFRF
jgi:hypothetical protein